MNMYKLDKQIFGSFVAAVRKEKGWTQKELAQQLFVSDKAVSKWETGVSLPDTALLLPLSQALDVTVTELLLCRRIDAPLPPEQAEEAVQSVLQYKQESIPRAWQAKSKWMFLFPASAALCIGELLLFPDLRSSTLLTLLGMGGVFGAYFVYLAPEKLDKMYDENNLHFFLDGPVRMNFPGVRFHNGTWKAMLRALRCWSCLMPAVLPNLALLLKGWAFADFVLLFLFMIGLFLPVYLTGREKTCG